MGNLNHKKRLYENKKNDIIQGMYPQIHTPSTGFSGTFHFLYLLLQNKVITLKTEFNQICIFLVTVNLKVSLIIMICPVETPHPWQCVL